MWCYQIYPYRPSVILYTSINCENICYKQQPGVTSLSKRWDFFWHGYHVVLLDTGVVVKVIYDKVYASLCLTKAGIDALKERYISLP